jgi:2-keto-3-deoxy-L-rhamnonate aldolase RhmA
MMDGFAEQVLLKEKIKKGAPTLGLFVKTPSMHIVELLGSARLDFIVLDAEHAPFSIEALDKCILAARAAGIKALVRVDSASSKLIQSVLDMGAAGVVVPHIRSAKEASQAVATTRYANGTRGFSPSHRAAGYGAIPATRYRESSDDAIIVIGQIEDAVAVECIDEIAAVPGLDALFIGSADLSISLGVALGNNPTVKKAVDTVCDSCRKADRRIGMFLPTVESIDEFSAQGVSLFFISSDQALLKKAVGDLVSSFNSECS